MRGNPLTGAEHLVRFDLGVAANIPNLFYLASAGPGLGESLFRYDPATAIALNVRAGIALTTDEEIVVVGGEDGPAFYLAATELATGDRVAYRVTRSGVDVSVDAIERTEVPGVRATGLRSLTVVGQNLFLVDGESLRVVSTSSGRATLLRNFDPNNVAGHDASLSNLTSVDFGQGPRLVFVANLANSATSIPFGSELWISDATAPGTALLADVNLQAAGRNTQSSAPGQLTVIGNLLYFAAYVGTQTTNRELWQTDGTAVGTVLAKEFQVGAPGGFANGSSLLIAGSSRLFMTADDGSGMTLWSGEPADGNYVQVNENLGLILTVETLFDEGDSYAGPNDVTDVARFQFRSLVTARSGLLHVPLTAGLEDAVREALRTGKPIIGGGILADSNDGYLLLMTPLGDFNGLARVVVTVDDYGGSEGGPIAGYGRTADAYLDTYVGQFSGIYGSKFEDVNGNGSRDVGEPGIEGGRIYLDRNGDNIADQSTLTDRNGDYAFTNLPWSATGHSVWEAIQTDSLGTVSRYDGIVINSSTHLAKYDLGGQRQLSILVTSDGTNSLIPPALEGQLVYLSATSLSNLTNPHYLWTVVGSQGAPLSFVDPGDSATTAFIPLNQGDYVVTLVVSSAPGAASPYSYTTTTRVIARNVKPTLVSATPPVAWFEGENLLIDVVATDVDSLDYVLDVDVDADGNFYSPNDVHLARTVGQSIPWTSVLSAGIGDGTVTYSSRARVRDNDGGFSEYAYFALTLNNAGPVVNAGGNYAITEGDDLHLSATANDPAGAADPLSYAWDLDNDGASRDYSRTIIAVNAPPTAIFELSSSGAIQEGASGLVIRFVGAADPSQADFAAGLTYSYDLDGDGVFEIVGVSTSSQPISFPQEGSYTIRGRIHDRDGGTSEYTLHVAVQNAAPQIVSFNGATTGNEGSSIAFTGSVADPGADVLTAHALIRRTSVANDPGIEIPVFIAANRTFHFEPIFDTDIAGGYDVVLVVNDGSVTSQQSRHIAINNVIPAIVSQLNATIASGRHFTRNLAYADPGKDQWIVKADFGQGLLPIPFDSDKQTFTLDHIFATPGTYLVRAEVFDGVGAALTTFKSRLCLTMRQRLRIRLRTRLYYRAYRALGMRSI